jgi:UDP-N-acetylglucosamine 2-epimerase (non-hydrolysing)
MKMAPVVHEIKRRGWPMFLVHTGQHYDKNMSDVFFHDLDMPRPDIFLNVGSDTHARQTAQVMIAFETLVKSRRPNLVVVAGDVNSTVAVALTAAKECIPVAHVEAGLRSCDRTMPEEVNRIVTDQLSELLFTTEDLAGANLEAEGVDPDRIHFVGNCMVDSLRKHLNRALDCEPWRRFNLERFKYALVTLHRPSNVDTESKLAELVEVLNEVASKIPIIFPVHPRTRARLSSAGVQWSPNVVLCEPLAYLEFLGLMAKARFVMTDSGGVQEETTALQVPCLTLRANTERPITITQGSNRLVGTERARIVEKVEEILRGKFVAGRVPELWDGHAAERIGAVLAGWLDETTRPKSRRPGESI